MRLRDLEQRLREEPENLGLRVTYAGALREVGQHTEAVELYRSVAIAYRDQGRIQQAIACCRSILEIAPDDVRCHVLLETLLGRTPRPEPAPAPAPAEPPERPSAFDETPLPVPLPYHDADPTTKSHEKVEPGVAIDRISGIANAARRISASLIASSDDDDDPAAEVVTQRRPLIDPAEIAAGSMPSPDDDLFPLPEQVAMDDDAVTLPPPVRSARPRPPFELRSSEDQDGKARAKPELSLPRPRDTDEEMTLPRALPTGTSQRAPSPGPALLASAFFAPLPRDRRSAVLTRFHRRAVHAGEIVIRQGETGHALVVVVRGRLEVRAERADGKQLTLAVIGPGDYIGEAPLLSRVPSPNQVIATVASELLLLPPRDFYEIAGAFPALWAQLKDVAERRTREHEARLKR